jgi:hypothetical protein
MAEPTERRVRSSIPRPALHASGTEEREPLRDPVHDTPRRTRRRKSTVNEDMFYIPLDEIPEGSSYEWKRWSLSGQEDPFYIAQMREQGWEPVNPKKHPTWVPPGYSQPHNIKGGLILMERPIELTREAQAEQRKLAKTQIREAEQRLGMTPKDTLTRQHSGVEPKVVKEYMRPVQVIEE